ncbi:MAG: glycosyltransferase [Terrimesophilobacter sp.]
MTSIRLFIGPSNLAGQGWAWARAVEEFLPNVGAVAMSGPKERRFSFSSDQLVPFFMYRWSPSWRIAQIHALTREYTHVIAESARPLFGDALGRNLLEDVRRLQASGVSVALLFHGSDIRLPSRHAVRSQWSPFAKGLMDVTPALEASVQKACELTANLGLPTFVSTPDLLLDLPSAEWLPVVVDIELWRARQKPFSSHDLPIVAHAPSRAILKGSDLIDPILVRLDHEGLLRYRRVEGVPSKDMPGIYKDADIVIDQVRLGIYGVAACEAMAAGRIVVSHVSQQVRDHVLASTGLALPIVETNPDELESTIRAIIADPREYVAMAEGGVQFVGAIHSGKLSAERLRSFLTMRSTHG